MLKEKAVNDNLGLVHSIANRFRGRGIEYDDLFSAGCLGLVKAIDRFDEGRGLCFSTYAVPLIMGEIKGLFRKSGTVKISRSIKETALKASRCRLEYINRTGNEPTIKEIAEIIGTSEELTAEAMCACRHPISLTAGDEEGDEFSQFDIPVESGEERLAEHLSLKQELSNLSESDRSLISLRYFRGLTQTQTAKILGTSQVQVSRREKKILVSLREKLAV